MNLSICDTSNTQNESVHILYREYAEMNTQNAQKVKYLGELETNITKIFRWLIRSPDGFFWPNQSKQKSLMQVYLWQICDPYFRTLGTAGEVIKGGKEKG
jgi:hypothetical protein